MKADLNLAVKTAQPIVKAGQARLANCADKVESGLTKAANEKFMSKETWHAFKTILKDEWDVMIHGPKEPVNVEIRKFHSVKEVWQTLKEMLVDEWLVMIGKKKP